MAMCVTSEKEKGNDEEKERGTITLGGGGKQTLQNVVQHFLHATLFALGRHTANCSS